MNAKIILLFSASSDMGYILYKTYLTMELSDQDLFRELCVKVCEQVLN